MLSHVNSERKKEQNPAAGRHTTGQKIAFSLEHEHLHETETDQLVLLYSLLFERDDPWEVGEGADSRGVAEFLVGRYLEAELDDALDMWKDDRHFRLHKLVKNLQRLASLFL